MPELDEKILSGGHPGQLESGGSGHRRKSVDKVEAGVEVWAVALRVGGSSRHNVKVAVLLAGG